MGILLVIAALIGVGAYKLAAPNGTCNAKQPGVPRSTVSSFARTGLRQRKSWSSGMNWDGIGSDAYQAANIRQRDVADLVDRYNTTADPEWKMRYAKALGNLYVRLTGQKACGTSRAVLDRYSTLVGGQFNAIASPWTQSQAAKMRVFNGSYQVAPGAASYPDTRPVPYDGNSQNLRTIQQPNGWGTPQYS